MSKNESVCIKKIIQKSGIMLKLKVMNKERMAGVYIENEKRNWKSK